MSSSHLTEGQIAFIDELAEMLSIWSIPAKAARLYGYLYLMNDPVGLDDIARDLQMSRSHAHTAARMLEMNGNVRAMATRGSKRIVYVCGDDPGTPLRRQIANLGRMAEFVATSASRVATDGAAARLDHLAAFLKQLKGAMHAVVEPDGTTSGD
ncbi:MAG: hypothetical protein ABW184_02695 [Sphingobium sp.]